MSAAILASLPTIFDLINKLAPGFQYLIQYVKEIRTVLTQSGEWTAALETQFLESLIATHDDPKWQPDNPA